MGEMALALALDRIESQDMAKITNYSEYLELHPPIHRVEILENTSWSCVHGVERWRSDCGCNSGIHPGWSQDWRGPLRQALDWLRDTVAPQYEEKALPLLKDPWTARDDYVAVVLDRSSENVDRFLDRHATRELDTLDRVTVLKLLELQRHALLMYTSCGWFFDELSGLETVQCIRYAGRVVDLAEQLFREDIEPAFLERLAQAKSNIPEHSDGAQIYRRWVRPAVIDLPTVAAHYAIASVFDPPSESERVYCYDIERQNYTVHEQQKKKLAIGRLTVSSAITAESATLSLVALHLGNQDVRVAVREAPEDAAYLKLVTGLLDAFSNATASDIALYFDEAFGKSTHSLHSLFEDERRQILNLIIAPVLADAEALHLQFYERNADLLRFLAESGPPIPKSLRVSAELTLNYYLLREFLSDEPNLRRVVPLIEKANVSHVDLDVPMLSRAFQGRLEQMAENLSSFQSDPQLLSRFWAALEVARWLPFSVNLWRVQNLFYDQFSSRICKQVGSGQMIGGSQIGADLAKVSEVLLFAPEALNLHLDSHAAATST
jgi:hypothetical protein